MSRLDQLMNKNAGEGAALKTNAPTGDKKLFSAVTIRKIPAAFLAAFEELQTEEAARGRTVSQNQFVLDAIREKLERAGKLK